MANPKLALIPSAYKAGTLYSPLPTNGDGDFTFTRNSGATRVNKDGLIENVGETLGSEEVTNGSFNTDTDWAVSGEDGTHIVTFNNSLRYQSGTTSPVLSVTQDLVFEVGKLYKLEIVVSDLTSGYVKTDAFGQSNNLTTSAGTVIVYGVATSSTLSILRGTTNVDVTIDSISVREVLTEVNIPRLDYSDGSCPSLLLEPQRTNLFSYSSQINNTIWNDIYGGTGVEPVMNSSTELAKDGTLSACEWTFNTGVGTTASDESSIYYNSITTSVGLTYCFSVYVYSSEDNVEIQLRGAGSIYKRFTLNEGWNRIIRIADATATTTYPIIGLRQGLGGGVINSNITVKLWGAQFEQGSSATSYIPTIGSIATRVADLCAGSGDADVFNDDEGVLYAQIGVRVDNGFISLNNGGTANRVSIYFNETNRTIRPIISNGAVSQMDTTYTSPTSISDNVKVAMKYKENDFALWVNGVEVLTDSSGLTPTGLDRFDFSINGILPFYGKCKEVKYYDKALTDAELTELTT